MCCCCCRVVRLLLVFALSCVALAAFSARSGSRVGAGVNTAVAWPPLVLMPFPLCLLMARHCSWVRVDPTGGTLIRPPGAQENLCTPALTAWTVFRYSTPHPASTAAHVPMCSFSRLL